MEISPGTIKVFLGWKSIHTMLWIESSWKSVLKFRYFGSVKPIQRTKHSALEQSHIQSHKNSCVVPSPVQHGGVILEDAMKLRIMFNGVH